MARSVCVCVSKYTYIHIYIYMYICIYRTPVGEWGLRLDIEFQAKEVVGAVAAKKMLQGHVIDVHPSSLGIRAPRLKSVAGRGVGRGG